MLSIVVVTSLVGFLAAFLLEAQPLTIVVPRWLWYILVSGLCITFTCVTFSPRHWYLGCAGAAGALLLLQITDLLLVAIDLTFIRHKEALARIQSK